MPQLLSVVIINGKREEANQLVQQLKSLEVNNINISYDAEDGVSKAKKYSPDIIFLDNNLSNFRGTTLLSELKKASQKSKIILMSDKFEMNDIASAIELGADYLFDKNETSQEYINKIVDATIKAREKNESVWNIMNLFKTKIAPEKNTNKVIAIVEDNELFAFYLSWTLNQLGKGYIISTFSNGKDFITYMDSSKPEHIFLDYYLPDLNGKQILEQIKSKSPNSNVVVISSLESPQKAMELKEIGINHYIVKDRNLKENVKKLISSMSL